MKRNLIKMEIKPVPLHYFTSADFVWLHWYENIKHKFLFPLIIRFIEKSINKGQKIIWNVHNKKPHINRNQVESIYLMKLLAKVSHKIVIHSHISTEIVKELCDSDETVLNKIIYVPHPHYIDIYGEQAKNISLDNNTLKLCFLGAVKNYKNVDLLISAVRELNTKAIHLSIYGESSSKKYAEYLSDLIGSNKNIKLNLRFISDKQIPEILTNHHLIVLPYNLDSTLNSGSNILAFSYGRTVLSPVTGTLSDIENDSMYFSYHYSDQLSHKEEIKRQILEIFDKYKGNYNDLLKMGESCKQYVAENHSSEQVITQLNKVFTYERG